MGIITKYDYHSKKDIVHMGMLLLLQVMVKQQDAEECSKKKNSSSKLKHQQITLQYKNSLHLTNMVIRP